VGEESLHGERILNGVLEPSASRTIFRLYSTVNRRRCAFATTSTSGSSPIIPVALMDLQSLPALDIITSRGSLVESRTCAVAINEC